MSDQIREELSGILKRLPVDPMGCIDLGRDGVLRSFAANRDILDATGLRPSLIEAFLDGGPFQPDHKEQFRGIDGSQVPREAWLHPDESMIPPALSNSEKQKGKEELEIKRKKRERDSSKEQGGR